MKKRGIKKRILAALMTACMVVGSVPGSALADMQDIKREAAATYDYYVDANIGSDSNDGKSETNAFKTVKKAAETAGSGAKIKLGDGKYTLYKINSTGTTKGKDLTFIGNGADKTGWNIGAKVPDPANFGTEYNGDYSFDGAGTVTFKNMTLQSGNADYLGIIRADNTIVEDCTINGKTFYWGYERAEFKNTIFNCPKGDYALWTYSSPVMTFDHCTFNASGKVINVYTDASAGKHDITVNYKDCTVISTSKNKSVLNINDSNMGNYKYYVNISGNNTVSGLGTDTYTCSKLFAYGGLWKHYSNNKGKSVIQIDGKPVWQDGKMVAHEIDTENDKYTDGYKENAYKITNGDWTAQADGSYTRTLTAKCNYCGWVKSETETVVAPTEEDLTDVDVIVKCTNSNAEHNPISKEYPISGGYNIGNVTEEDGTLVSEVTVESQYYVDMFNEECGVEHPVNVDGLTFKMIWDSENKAWKAPEKIAPIEVACADEEEPLDPELPTKDELEDLIGEVVLVHTGSNAEHQDAKYELIKGSYNIASASNAKAIVTVKATEYKDAYNQENGPHTVLGRTSVTLILAHDENGWFIEKGKLPVTFTVKCTDKTPETPEKQYTEIKFVVVNGTFTENGQTELTKTFEVGTKLTLADIPASKGKSSSYSDQTWDKFPVGYVVGKDGTTFTITYRWRSSGSDSDDSDYDYGTSTRGKATNAAGKSGRWILEGGEFTEDNGRLPSNEYLKIGDTIYGFYTYGFAIDFDRPEYYTDAAIQAKGGYRDATGTWRLNGWWFCYDDGTFPHDEWVYLTWNGRSDWYYFDVDGWMEDGWLYRNNNWYYLHTQYDNTRGRMYTGWHEIDGKWYYFNTASDKGTLGAMLANTTTPDGYQVDANGAWIR